MNHTGFPLIEGQVYARRDGFWTAPLKWSQSYGLHYDINYNLFYNPDGSMSDKSDVYSYYTSNGGRGDLVGLVDRGVCDVAPCIDEKSGKIEEVAVKHDADKVPYDILPLDLLDGAAKVFGHGAKKYSRNNFRKGGGFDPYRPLGAALRHLTEVQRALDTGDHDVLIDKDFGESHLAHAICSLLILTDSMRQKGWKA